MAFDILFFTIYKRTHYIDPFYPKKFLFIQATPVV